MNTTYRIDRARHAVVVTEWNGDLTGARMPHGWAP